MQEYFVCSCGNNILMCKDTDEAVIFDSFGAFKSRCSYREALALCGTGFVSPANFCSISGKFASDVEVYYDGKRKKVSVPHSIIFNKLKNVDIQAMKSITPFRMKGVDDIPITILVFDKSFSLESLSRLPEIGGLSGWLEV